MNSEQINLLARYMEKELMLTTPDIVWDMYDIYDKIYAENRIKLGFYKASIKAHEMAIEFLMEQYDPKGN